LALIKAWEESEKTKAEILTIHVSSVFALGDFDFNKPTLILNMH
jgi:hypothetical protein